MRRARLVRGLKRGTSIEYSLVCERVTHFVECLEKGVAEKPGEGG